MKQRKIVSDELADVGIESFVKCVSNKVDEAKEDVRSICLNFDIKAEIDGEFKMVGKGNNLNINNLTPIDYAALCKSLGVNAIDTNTPFVAVLYTATQQAKREEWIKNRARSEKEVPESQGDITEDFNGKRPANPASTKQKKFVKDLIRKKKGTVEVIKGYIKKMGVETFHVDMLSRDAATNLIDFLKNLNDLDDKPERDVTESIPKKKPGKKGKAETVGFDLEPGYKMGVNVKINKEGAPEEHAWEETMLVDSIDEPAQIIKAFNKNLKVGEDTRVIISVKKDEAIKIHRWNKMNLVSLPDGSDEWKCKDCEKKIKFRMGDTLQERGCNPKKKKGSPTIPPKKKNPSGKEIVEERQAEMKETRDAKKAAAKKPPEQPTGFSKGQTLILKESIPTRMSGGLEKEVNVQYNGTSGSLYANALFVKEPTATQLKSIPKKLEELTGIKWDYVGNKHFNASQEALNSEE